MSQKSTQPTLFERIDLYTMISATAMIFIIIASALSNAELGTSMIAISIVITGLLIIAITGRRYSKLMEKQDQIIDILERRL